jgi:hypothetical protein
VLSGYKEKHHVIPKSFGGSNKKENLVELTAREHFICHWLLTKMTAGLLKGKMIYAVWMLATNNNPHQKREKISSRKYEILKRLMAEKEISDETRRKMGLGRLGKAPPNKGVSMSEEQKEKLRQVNLGKTIPPEQVAKMLSTKEKNGTLRVVGSWKPKPESIKKMQETVAEKKANGWINPNIGRKMPEETVAKMKAIWTPEKRQRVSELRSGVRLSDEHKAKLKEARTKRTAREREERQRKIDSGEIIIPPKQPPKKRGPVPGTRKLTDEQKLKISVAHRGKKGHPISDATKEKLRQANTGRIVTEETRKKLSEGQKGRKLSEEHVAKLREAAKKKPPVSAATRKKLSEAGKGRKRTPEEIAKFSATRKGHVVSEETRQKIRDSLLAKNALKKVN